MQLSLTISFCCHLQFLEPDLLHVFARNLLVHLVVHTFATPRDMISAGLILKSVTNVKDTVTPTALTAS